jgi:hypothetical protein
LVLVYHLFRALEITYKKGTPMESIVKLFSDSLKLKRSSSDLVPSHSLKLVQKNIYWHEFTPFSGLWIMEGKGTPR